LSIEKQKGRGLFEIPWGESIAIPAQADKPKPNKDFTKNTKGTKKEFVIFS